MLILGIDPGTVRMGYAIIETKNSQPHQVLSIGYIDLSGVTEHPEKLKLIYDKLKVLIDKYQPHALAIESSFYGKNVQSMLKLGRSQGIAMAVAFSNNLSITEYAPKKIKLSITGNGNASKEQVFAMLKNIIKFEYTDRYLDATDALAVAVCHCFQLNNISTGNPLKRGSHRKNSWKYFIDKNPNRKV